VPEFFLEFSADFDELNMINSGLAVIKNHAFRHVRGLKTLDLSENRITQIENEAFTEVIFCSKAYCIDDGMNSYYMLKVLEDSHYLFKGSVIAFVWAREEISENTQ
jgi:hypothetical protein